MTGGFGKECTLCGACVQVCPVGCIDLLPDSDHKGQIRAVIDTDRCVACHQCEGHCHLLGEVPFKKIQKAYAAVAADANYRKNGASGGAFAALAERCLQNGGIVFGCMWRKETWEAVHVKIEDAKDLGLLQGSKYVYSSTADSYVQARDALKQGRTVLYAGRPCQIAGLYCFLRKKYDNLITVDLVCHGVPDGKLFQEYIDYYEKKHGCRVVDWNFRAHSNGRQGCFGELTLEKKGKVIKKPLLWNCDSYYSTFMHAISYREECYSCHYARQSRVGDITLGDFWGIEHVFPGAVAGNISLVLANSQAGENLVKDCAQLTVEEVDIESACAHNGQLNAPVDKPENSGSFWELYRNGGWKAIDEKFLNQTKKKRLVAYAVYYFPQNLKKFIRKLRRR